MVRSGRKNRIGILGGTFDPVHFGHLSLAQTARRSLNLSRVIFIPARMPPHKERIKLTCAELRYKMIKLAIAGNKHFSVSRIEIEKKGISYSVQTLRLLKKKYTAAEFYFIVGSDALPELSSWKEIEEIFKLSNFVVAKRPNFRKYKWPREAIALDGEFLKISSSKIRQFIKKGESVESFLPKAVYKFIIKNSLYT